MKNAAEKRRINLNNDDNIDINGFDFDANDGKNDPFHTNSTPFVQSISNHPFKTPADMNSIDKNVNNMKYYADDTSRDIKGRLRRCVNKAKAGSWKRQMLHWVQERLLI